MSIFENATTLVTGAASGIGRETALALARQGARLIVCDINEEALAAVRSTFEEAGTVLRAERVDVSDRAAMAAFAASVHEEHGPLDILVNNAGIGLSGDIVTTPIEEWDRLMGVNLWGVIHGCHFFIPAMIEASKTNPRRRHVVNIASLLAIYGGPNLVAYTTAKHGVLGLSRALRADLRPNNIGVTAVCPGIIDTNIVSNSPFYGVDDPDHMRDEAVQFYQKRNYGPDRVARAIVKGVRRNKALLPVAIETWLVYYLVRFTPWAIPALDRLIAKVSVPK